MKCELSAGHSFVPEACDGRSDAGDGGLQIGLARGGDGIF